MFIKIITSFIRKFIIKYFGAVVIEKIVIILLGELVKSTDSNVDDRIYNEVFGKINEVKKEN